MGRDSPRRAMSLPRSTALALLCLLLAALAAATVAAAKTSHAGWPAINGMLLMNKLDQSRPLDARPGHDPFGGTDPEYRCDGLHRDTSCVGLSRWCRRHRSSCRKRVVVAAPGAT